MEDNSRKDAKGAKVRVIEKKVFLASFAAWREILLNSFLLNLSSLGSR